MSMPSPGAQELERLLQAAEPVEPMPVPGPTRVFGPRPPAPAAPRRTRTRVPLLLVPVVALGVWWLRPVHPSMRDCRGEALPVPHGAQVAKGDTSAAGCLSTGVYAGQVLTIRLRPEDRQPRRFALGVPGDVLSLGDWNCDGIATPSLYRPSTGETFFYNSWRASEKASTIPRDCPV